MILFKVQQKELALGVAVASLSTALLLHFLRRPARAESCDESNHVQELPYPPSPGPEHFIWGHSHLMPPIGGSSPDIQLLKWSDKLGSVFSYKVPVFGRFIVTTDPDMAHYVLAQHNFPKSSLYKVSWPLFGKNSMISAAHKEPHQSRRHLFHRGFQPAYLNECCLEIMKDTTKGLLERLREAKGGTIALLEYSQNYTSQIISSVAFGEDWSCATNPARQALRHMVELTMLAFDFSSGWSLLNYPFVWYHLLQQHRILHREMKSIVIDKFENPGNDILSLATQELLEVGNKSTPCDEDIDMMIDQLKTLYFAGHETTSNLISWTIWLLAQHSDVLVTLRDELKVKLHGDWSTASASDYKSCSYLDAVLKEVLRLYPPATVSRSGDSPKKGVSQWNGFRLNGATILLSMYVIHHSKENWGLDAEEFRPDRFLKDPNPKAFMPFSRGVYDCLGKSFAMLEAKVAVAAMVSAFDVEAIDPEKECICVRLTNQPKCGCKIQFSPREAGRERHDGARV